MCSHFCLSLCVAVVAVAGACLWVALPQVIGRLVERANGIPKGSNVGLERLKIGHAMAGGLADAAAGNEAMADAIKAMAVAKVMGPRHTQARGSWSALVDVLGAAERQYLSPSFGFGLGPKGTTTRGRGGGGRGIGGNGGRLMELVGKDWQ